MESAPDSSKKSYGQILKSSALLGSSSAVIAVVGLLRNKAIALILGTGGAGWWTLCWSISELARTIAGVGLNNSGVRQIAEAVGTGDHQKIARTVVTLRRVSVVLGVLGAIGLCALCVPVAQWWFKDREQAGLVALVALTVLFNTISQGQIALIQGMRRIGDYARNSLFGAVLGTAVSIPLIYILYRLKWNPPLIVALALVGATLMTVLSSWWFARKIKLEVVSLSRQEITTEARGLLKLGFVFMLSGVMTQGVMSLVNIILMNRMDEEAVGLYGQAWLLSGYLAGFVFQAMGTDYYPRLTAVAHNHPECNRLVNEQAEVGMLLAGPALLATQVFAPWLLHLAASGKFLPATEVLRWFCLGMLLRAFSWPMAFVMLYLVYTVVAYLVVRRLTGFRFSAENLRIATVYIGLAAGVFLAAKFLITPVAFGLGFVAVLVTGIFSIKKLCALIPPERFPRRARQLLSKLRLLPASVNS